MICEIDNAICEGYESIRKNENVHSEIAEIYRQVRFKNPYLGVHIRERMFQIAKEKGDLP